MGLRLGPFRWHQTAAGTMARSRDGITSPRHGRAQPGGMIRPRFLPYGVSLTVGTAPVEEETFPTKAQGWHGPRGDTLQIYSISTPQAPWQPQLPETVALSPTPAPAPPPSPPPSLQRTGLDRILNPPSLLGRSGSGSRHVSMPLSCCQPGHEARRARGLQTAWCPTSDGDARMEVPGTSSACTALGLLPRPTSGSPRPVPSPSPVRRPGAGRRG